MAKIESEGKLPKRIDDYVIYQLNEQMIIRAISGFTSKALKNSPKYELSRQNASEFGRVSSLCKQVRVVLKEILPKKNNLLIVNSFTKKMREVMTCDTLSERGKRNLAIAMSNEEGRNMLLGYSFNTEANLALDYTIEDKSLYLLTSGIVFPEVSNCIGVRLHQLEFDFGSLVHQLESTAWVFYRKHHLHDAVVLSAPKLEAKSGVQFTLLELQFFVSDGGSYLPIVDDRSKEVLVVSVQ